MGAVGFAATPHAATPGVLAVGLEPGVSPSILSGTGVLLRADAALGIALLATPDVPSALAALAGMPGVAFAEADAPVFSASAFAADAHRWDAHRWDSGVADAHRWDAHRWDAIMWEGAQWEAHRWDASAFDAHRWDAHRWDAALCDAHRWDAHRWDAALCDAHRWDAHRWDGQFDLDPLFPYQWGLRNLNVLEAWKYFDGFRGRTICIVDTGVDYTHPDLAPNMWKGPKGEHGHDFVNDDSDPMDDAGHGTHVAGIAAAATGNGIGIAGVGNEQIMAVKVLNHKGVGGMGTLALGIRYCADQGANVISMSLSSTHASKAVERAVDYAAAKGALMVASAGNLGTCADCVSYPAAYPGVIAVTALTTGDQAAAFSRPGAYVELAAPGEKIAGTFPGDQYALGTGTSQATAYVAGAAALAWDVNADLSASQVRQRLRESARDIATPGWDAQTGWGVPDVAKLLQLLRAQ